MSELLVCLIKGHLACFCSCSGCDFCCGCNEVRPTNLLYFIHCIDCGKDLSSLGKLDMEQKVLNGTYRSVDELEVARLAKKSKRP